MSEQNTTGDGSQEQKSSDVLKNIANSSEYTEKKLEELGKVKDHKEKLKSIIEKNQGEVKKHEHIVENVRQKIGQHVSMDNKDDKLTNQEVRVQASEISQLQEADHQIERIVDLATQKDPYFAIKVARNLDDNFVLDKVHDGLIEDKVRGILIDKGLLKEL